MSKSTEDDNGRALEKIIVDRILVFNNIQPTKRCVIQQNRDISRVLRLEPDLKQKFNKSANEITDFLEEKFSINDSNFKLDRLDDLDDSVIDIVLAGDDEKFSFSIKHNNDKLKHNRPYSLIQNGLGFKKHSLEDKEHRVQLDKICKDFRILHPDKKLFRDLSFDAKENLYYKFANECLISLKKYKNNKEAVANWFKFMMGLESKYIKIKVFTKGKSQGVFYEDFRDLSVLPEKMDLSIYKGKRTKRYAASWNIIVDFKNGYKFNNRIHNKSSRISSSGQLSIAFDVKFTDDSIQGKKLI